VVDIVVEEDKKVVDNILDYLVQVNDIEEDFEGNLYFVDPFFLELKKKKRGKIKYKRTGKLNNK
jgi:hypothetical protein